MVSKTKKTKSNSHCKRQVLAKKMRRNYKFRVTWVERYVVPIVQTCTEWFGTSHVVTHDDRITWCVVVLVVSWWYLKQNTKVSRPKADRESISSRSQEQHTIEYIGPIPGLTDVRL